MGKQLYGGWFDAGDHVKFGFPMAWTTTVLAWGMIDYENVIYLENIIINHINILKNLFFKEYKAMGEWDNALGSIRWALEFFIRAHTSKFEFYGQVKSSSILEISADASRFRQKNRYFFHIK